VIGAPVLEPQLGRQVIAEGDIQGWQRFVGCVIEPVRLVEQQLHAHEVGDQQIEREMQHRSLGGQRQPYVEHRPAARFIRATTHVLADRLHVVRGPVRGLAAKVEDRDLIGGNIGPDLLEAPLVDHGPQHRVALDQRLPGRRDNRRGSASARSASR
jgi:hypothetical protein